MKSLTTIIQNKELILTKAKDADLIEISFSKRISSLKWLLAGQCLDTVLISCYYRTVQNR